MTALDAICGGLSLAAFLAAELLRPTDLRSATVTAMVGWLLLGAVAMRWARGRSQWRTMFRSIGRVALLTVTSAAVLTAYLLRSQVIDAGSHVDATYTFRGARWFLELDNPITFATRTPSYHQFPFMALAHVPAAAVGVWHLGPLAVHLGILLNVAVLFAIVIERLTRPAGLIASTVGVLLLSAAFSNRFLVLGYDCVGYVIPAVCLGLMALVVADREAVPAPERCLGGLLTMATLHYYTAFFIVGPICALWLVACRTPVRTTWRFIRANPLLLLVLALAAITVSTHPDLLLQRVHDVTAGATNQHSWFEPALERARQNVATLRTSFWTRWYHDFVVTNRGSWHLLNVAPLGGALLPMIAGSFICSVIAFRGLRARYAAHALGLAVVVVALTLVLHMLTDFSDYRDFTALTAIMVVTLGFAVRLPRLDGWTRIVVLAWGIAMATFNWWDLAALHGKVHSTGDYGVRSQAVLERLRHLARAGVPELLGVERAVVVLDSFYALEPEYVAAFAARNFPVAVVKRAAYCENPAGAIDRELGAGRDGVLVLRPKRICDDEIAPSSDGPAVALEASFYPSVSGSPR
jgi:hypothetical protein